LYHRLKFLFDIGFIDIYVSGKVLGYSYVLDECYGGGPVSGFFSSFFFKTLKNFSHFLFISVDTFFLNKAMFFNFFFKCRFFISYFFNCFIMPLLLAVSFGVVWILFNFYLFYKNESSSITFFLKFVLFYCSYTCVFFRMYFFDINTYYSLILYSVFID
jgi:hypothetical protein